VPVDNDMTVSEGAVAEAPSRRSNRGFWLVAGSLLLASVFMLVEIFANFGMKDTVAHAEHTLRGVQAAAERIRDADGSLAAADQIRLATMEPTFSYVAGDDVAHGLDQVSVATAGSAWAAAVEVRPGACFYLHLLADGRVFYGAGTVCTGREALQATDPRW
jgi:hypothetical protein